MSIDKILSRIDEESAEAVREIISRAEEEAAAVSREYAARAGELGAALEAKAEKKAAEEKRRLLVSEKLELRKAALVKKREILSTLYEDAKKRIEGLSGEDYLSLMQALVISAAVSGGEEIVPAAGQGHLFDAAFIGKLNDAFPGGGNFTVASEEGSFKWGVVLREGRHRVDLSLETVFEQIVDRIEPEVSAILFGERE